MLKRSAWSFACTPRPLGGGRALPDLLWGDLMPNNPGGLPSEFTESHGRCFKWPTTSWMTSMWSHISFSRPCLRSHLPVNYTWLVTLSINIYKIKSCYEIVWISFISVVLLQKPWYFTSVCCRVRWLFPGKSAPSCNLAFMVRGYISEDKHTSWYKRRWTQMKGRGLGRNRLSLR